MGSPPFILHILSLLTVIHTPRGECSRLAERLPEWLRALQQPVAEMITPRALRRWHLLYVYWQQCHETLLGHSLRRGHLDANLCEQVRSLTPLLAPPNWVPQAVSLDHRLWACFITSFGWSEMYGVAYPLTIRRVASEERIPPFHLSARIQEAALTAAGNLAIEGLSLALGRRLGLKNAYPLAVDAAFPDELRLTDESASLAFAMAALKELCQIGRPGLAASGIVLRDSGRIQQVQGFTQPYGKLEAAFDAGVRELLLPWETPVHDLPKAGICVEKQAEGCFRYFFRDAPEDAMQIYWVQDLEQAIDRLWGDQEAEMVGRLRSLSGSKKQGSFRAWESLYLKIEKDYPEWLAVPFRIYFQYYRDLSELPPSDPREWQDMLRLQSNWILLWLRYLLNLQASGGWLAQQALEQSWPSFPACCEPDSTPYLLWQAVQEVCRTEQKGPLPFRQMHQWLCKHQTGWGMLLNQLIQLDGETDLTRIREGMRYNMLRLMELLKSADFMFTFPLYGVLEEAGEQAIGLQYRGITLETALHGVLPARAGELFLEEPRTRVRFQLPFLRLCPQCLSLEHFTPVVWVGQDKRQGHRFAGCEHSPVWVKDVRLLERGKPSAVYGRAVRKTWPHAIAETGRLEGDGRVPEPVEMACVLHTELVLNTLSTLQDPQQIVAVYERMILQLMNWLELDPHNPKEMWVHYSLQANTLVFFGSPQYALNFALALHKLVSDYNQRQNLPSAHLQIRSALALGTVLRVPDQERGRVLGQPVSQAVLLAGLARGGQILATESVQAVLAPISTAHRRVFQYVGTSREKGLAGPLYTVVTRTTGVRELPASLWDCPTAPLEGNQVETLDLVQRKVTLGWFCLLEVSLVDLGLQTALTQREWIRQLGDLLGECVKSVSGMGEGSLLPTPSGYVLVSTAPLEGPLQCLIKLYRRLQQLKGKSWSGWEFSSALQLGLAELRSDSQGQLTLLGPARELLQDCLAQAGAGQIVADAWTVAFLAEADPALKARFFPFVCESLTLYSYWHEGVGRSLQTPPCAEGKRAFRAPGNAENGPEVGLSLGLDALLASDLPVLQGPARLELYRSFGGSAGVAPATPRKRKPVNTSLAKNLQNHLGMIFTLIEPGRFMMGSPGTEAEREPDEQLHLVLLSRPFYLLTTPVTQRQWQQVMGTCAIHFAGPDLPVDAVTWRGTQAFIAKLNALGETEYRLPTEAEWEYACRAGSFSAYCFGNQLGKLKDYAWYKANAGEGYPERQLHPVATRLPNAWGLYDMHGNVWEWVSDGYAELPAVQVTDPQGFERATAKVIKGGRWASGAGSCRSASRSFLLPDETHAGSVGFRLVLELP